LQSLKIALRADDNLVFQIMSGAADADDAKHIGAENLSSTLSVAQLNPDKTAKAVFVSS